MTYQRELFSVDASEAPAGFYAAPKSEAKPGENICNSCDARRLCQENADDWCLKNRCMSFPIVAANGITYQRQDGRSVIFKRRA